MLLWPPSYDKQGSNLTKGQILHFGPLRRKSRQVHSPLQRPASSSLVLTPVPFAPTGDISFKEVLLLGNAPFLSHVGAVSSVSQSSSVTSVSNVLAVVTSPPVVGRLQVFWQTWASMGASYGYTLPFQTKPPLTREPFAGVVSVSIGKRTSLQPVLPRVLQPLLFGSKTKQQ